MIFAFISKKVTFSFATIILTKKKKINDVITFLNNCFKDVAQNQKVKVN